MSGLEPPPPEDRPRAVTVIGAVWLIFGVFRVLSGLLGLAIWQFGGLQEMSSGKGFFSELPGGWVLRLGFRHFGASLLLQIVVGIAIAISAYALLRLRPWARTVIEVLCWLGLTFVVCFAAMWALFWTRVPQAAARPAWTASVGVAVALGICGGLAAAFVAMIRSLRRPEIRGAFGGP
ncbi:MAG: hypothetical protein ACM3SU_10660 [Acidobacteriota bacterium]